MAGVTIGFLGAGRMAQALSKGFMAAELLSLQPMIASDVNPDIAKQIEGEGVRTTSDNTEVVRQSSVVILAVKPDVLPDVLREVAPQTTPDHLIISIAAGVTTASIEKHLPRHTRVVRVMPNTPSLVHAGASVYCAGVSATPADGALVSRLFSGVGICENLPEKNMDAVTGLSGSGPAYGFLAVEALADGGVRMGLPRDVALRLAAQTLMGAAKMVLETGQHPGVLKDAVCSPGGTTIAGVHALERGGFRCSLMEAVEGATLRSIELSNNSQSKK